MKQVAPIPTGYEMSRGVAAVLEAIKKLDPGQQITVLRNTVVTWDSSLLLPVLHKAAEPIRAPSQLYSDHR